MGRFFPMVLPVRFWVWSVFFVALGEACGGILVSSGPTFRSPRVWEAYRLLAKVTPCTVEVNWSELT